MIDHFSVIDDTILVHLKENSLKATKSFTHGGIQFATQTQLISFGKLAPVPMPAGHLFSEGMTINFQLMSADGVKRQTRSGVLSSDSKAPDTLRIAGKAKTERKFSAADGWVNVVYKYRAYSSHPPNEGEFPEWLKDSVQRQNALWNRLAYLCREARRKCLPEMTRALHAFIQGTVFPEIDAYGAFLGKVGQIRHPAKLDCGEPKMSSLLTFATQLSARVRVGRGVPTGLLEKIMSFARTHKPDYAPIEYFVDNLTATAEAEAKLLGLKFWERKPVLDHFQRALKRRKTLRSSWSEAWPGMKHPDSPRSHDWGLHYYLGQAGIDSSDLVNGKGIPCLSFGPALPPAATGHHQMTGVASRRALRDAVISIPNKGGERWKFSFRVLQHRPLPPDSHLKEWKLIHKDGALWLCLVVEVQRRMPPQTQSSVLAELRLEWSPTEHGIRFGTMYESATQTSRDLTIAVQEPRGGVQEKVPFCVEFRSTRWEKRNMKMLVPDWNPGEAIPNVFAIRTALETRRDSHRNNVKKQLRAHLRGILPPEVQSAGSNGLQKFAKTHPEDTDIQEIFTTWEKEDHALGRLISMYRTRSTKRIEAGHAHIAHDICGYLEERGIHHILLETAAPACSVRSKDQSHEAALPLHYSPKFNDIAAIGKFLLVLKGIAGKRGILVEDRKGTASFNLSGLGQGFVGLFHRSSVKI